MMHPLTLLLLSMSLLMIIGVPVSFSRFVRFPDEDHDLSRTGRPRHRLARFRILLEWFGEHLRPDSPRKS